MPQKQKRARLTENHMARIHYLGGWGDMFPLLLSCACTRATIPSLLLQTYMFLRGRQRDPKH